MLRVYILSVTRYHSSLMCKDRHIFRDPSLSRKLSQFFKNIPLSLLRKIERIAFAEYIFLSEELKNPHRAYRCVSEAHRTAGHYSASEWVQVHKVLYKYYICLFLLIID
jgi:hypothetical protein